VWQADTTAPSDRKRIARLLLERVTVMVDIGGQHRVPWRTFSRTRLSCPLRAQAYEAYRSGSAFGGDKPAYST
jgi:hypothetical protein